MTNMIRTSTNDDDIYGNGGQDKDRDDNDEQNDDDDKKNDGNDDKNKVKDNNYYKDKER